MKSCFVAIVAVLSFVSFAVAGDSGEIKSVVVIEAPACASGRCQTQKLYNVEQETSEHCRNRLFGGHVVRKTNRTVYKPVRR